VRRTAVAAAALLALAGCIPEEGPMMAPGRDCMECHASGAGEEEAKPWTVAGTISGRRGAHVTITDQNGWSFTLRSNQAGNFYTAEGVALPLRAISVDGASMSATDMARTGQMPNPGSCNAAGCHPGGVGGSGGN
jgi:hypothetical protein